MDEPIASVQRNFRRSESIAALAASLAKAQGEMEGAKKDSANPYFKSKYADLGSVWDAIRKPFSANGLAVMQFPRSTDGGVEIETLLAHSSGEWVAETLMLPASKHDAQGLGSAITYARRYGLQSIAGVAPEDDDGNAAVAPIRNLRDASMKTLEAAAIKGTVALEAAWKGLTAEARKACQADLQGLKEKAANAS